MLEEKAVDILNQFEALAKQFAPDVIDAAIGVAQMNGFSNVVAGFTALVIAAVSAKISWKLFKFCKEKERSERYGEWEYGVIGSILIGGCAVFVSSLFAIGNLLDFWNWVAIFNPKLALAKSILGM